MNIILIILVFGVIIFFHELGHFIVAKINHISARRVFPWDLAQNSSRLPRRIHSIH